MHPAEPIGHIGSDEIYKSDAGAPTLRRQLISVGDGSDEVENSIVKEPKE